MKIPKVLLGGKGREEWKEGRNTTMKNSQDPEGKRFSSILSTRSHMIVLDPPILSIKECGESLSSDLKGRL